MRRDKVSDLVLERKAAHAQCVDVDAALGEHIERFLHRRAGRAIENRAESRRFFRRIQERRRHELLGGFELAQQPLYIIDVVWARLAVTRVAVLGCAAREVAAAGRMGSRIRAVRDAVAVDVEVAAEILAGLEFFVGHHLAAVVNLRVIPFERLAQARVHADVEIGHHKYRRLQAIGQFECPGGKLEAFGRVLRKQKHVLGIAVRSVGACEQVRLLGACRHAGRRPAALHVDDHRRNFRKIGEPDEFRHQ